jgi:hypothetical protein
MRTCLDATAMTLSSTPVICAAPATCPATINDLLISFNVRPANGAPLVVGTDISTMQLLSFVTAPEEVALEADEGRIMCSPVWSDMETLDACEKLGVLTGPRGAFANSSL